MRPDVVRAGSRGKQVARGVIVQVLTGIVCARAGGEPSRGAKVSGVVQMPEFCSLAVSPAVVYLTPADPAERRALLGNAKKRAASGRIQPADVVVVDQRGLQFVPRVQAIALGQTVRFTNQDGETHNVHVVSQGSPFNQSMSPGQVLDFTPEKPGVIRLACDIHVHMRGFVVVSPTPWFSVCGRDGRFRMD